MELNRNRFQRGKKANGRSDSSSDGYDELLNPIGLAESLSDEEKDSDQIELRPKKAAS